MEEIEKPSFENFLSKPGNLSDHLLWQLGAISVSSHVHDAAEVVIGNLSEDGYLIASDEEMLGVEPQLRPKSMSRPRQRSSEKRRRSVSMPTYLLNSIQRQTRRNMEIRAHRWTTLWKKLWRKPPPSSIRWLLKLRFRSRRKKRPLPCLRSRVTH